MANEFFNAAEFVIHDPNMANPPGSPGFDAAVYNPAFVTNCYTAFLSRIPEPAGLNFWVNVLNEHHDYIGVIGAFVHSTEFRDINANSCPH